MSAQLTIPALDSPGALHRWLIGAGDPVQQGQPVAIIVTQTQELAIPAAQAGTVATLLVAEGAAVESGGPLAALGAARQPPSARSRATPVARRIAAAQGIDLATLHGSGIGGVICKRDVLDQLQPADRALVGGFCVAEQMGNSLGAGDRIITVPAPASQAAAPAAPPADQRRSTLVPHPARTQGIGQTAVASSQHVPRAISAIAADMAQVEQVCRDRAAALARRGVELTATACLALATVRTLRRHRHLLASWGEDELIERAAFNLAVVRRERNVVLADAADLSLQGLARALGGHQSAAAAATFTLAHSDDSWWSGPLVAPNQAAVLHAGATSKQVVVQEHGAVAQVAIRPVATLTLAYDARIVSDEAAEAFLRTLRQEIEQFTG